MMAFRRMARSLAVPLATLMLATALPTGIVSASLVTTDQLIARDRVSSDRERVTTFLKRQDVRDQMRAMGVDPDEAAARVANLSDREIGQIAGRLDAMPAGEGAIGAVIGAAVFIFVVLLITDLLCLTSVFPFTRCVNNAGK